MKITINLEPKLRDILELLIEPGDTSLEGAIIRTLKSNLTMASMVDEKDFKTIIKILKKYKQS